MMSPEFPDDGRKSNPRIGNPATSGGAKYYLEALRATDLIDSSTALGMTLFFGVPNRVNPIALVG
jgi:hypothetical protein